jgi:hypothetical protein
MKTLAAIALAAIALSTTGCDQYLVANGLGHNDGQLAPPPQRCTDSDNDEVSPILTCTKSHKSTLLNP